MIVGSRCRGSWGFACAIQPAEHSCTWDAHVGRDKKFRGVNVQSITTRKRQKGVRESCLMIVVTAQQT